MYGSFLGKTQTNLVEDDAHIHTTNEKRTVKHEYDNNVVHGQNHFDKKKTHTRFACEKPFISVFFSFSLLLLLLFMCSTYTHMNSNCV